MTNNEKKTETYFCFALTYSLSLDRYDSNFQVHAWSCLSLLRDFHEREGEDEKTLLLLEKIKELEVRFGRQYLDSTFFQLQVTNMKDNGEDSPLIDLLPSTRRERRER